MISEGTQARALVALAVLATASCEATKKDRSSAMAAIASGSLAVRPPSPSVAAPAVPEKPVVRRPRDAADLLLSPERRAAVEAFAPETKGFLTALDLEEKLYAMNLLRGKDADALRALDQLAAGKWVLFTGNIGSPTADSLELPIRYTPKDPNDPMGLTSVWLSVKLTDIRGYQASEYRPGELAVVLAKYVGKRAARGGYDLVLMSHWF